MSTTIEGYKLHSGKTVFDLRNDVAEILRPQVLNHNIMSMLVASVEDYDGQLINEGQYERTFLDCTLVRLADTDFTNWRMENPRIYCVQHAETKETYAIFKGKSFSEEIFATLPTIAHEYGYWNGTDSYPEGVTREDWEVREKVWDSMVGYEPLASQTVLITCLPEYLVIPNVSRIREVLESGTNLPEELTLDYRAVDLAKRHIYREATQGVSFNEVISIYNELSRDGAPGHEQHIEYYRSLVQEASL